MVNASQPQSPGGFPFWAGTRLLPGTTLPALLRTAASGRAGRQVPGAVRTYGHVAHTRVLACGHHCMRGCSEGQERASRE